MKVRRALSYALVGTALAVLAAACGTTQDVDPVAPAIDAFTADATEVARGGGDVQLSWTVTGDADTLVLTNDQDATETDVTGQTRATVTLPTDAPTVTYALTATNDALAATDTADLAVTIELWVCGDDTYPVQVPDAALLTALRASPVIPDAGPIACSDMQALTTFATGHFEANPGDIASLVGLQHAVNLQTLDAKWNVVTDLEPLANLTSLTWLDLDKNAFTDVSPLAGLTNLAWLSMWDVGPLREQASDGLDDLGPLAGMTGMTDLYVSTNAIDDLGPLAGMTALQRLYFLDNQVDDLAPLAGATGLQALRAGFNAFADASVVAGMPDLAWLQLDYNLLTSIAPLGGLENLYAIDLEGNYLQNVADLAGNGDFPAATGTGLSQEPEDPTLGIGYNCLETDAGEVATYDGDDVATIEGRGVTVEGFDAATQRDTCMVGVGSELRELRLQEFRQSGER